MKKEILFRLYLTHPKAVPTVICHCRESSVSEIRSLALNGSWFGLARYRGKLCSVRPDPEPPLLMLSSKTETFRRVAIRELDAVFAACFEIRYQGRWYPCDMCGTTPEGQVCVIADDPLDTSGLATRHTHYMWGGGVEFPESQIEAVRLWTSDPIDPMLFTGETA